MTIILSTLCLLALTATLLWLKHRRGREKLIRYSISAEELHQILADASHPVIYDVRLPLDLLADPTIIPAALRVSPKDLIADSTLIPRDRDVIVYCTCPSDETSRLVMRKAHERQYFRVRFLRGGLGAWKALGYPVDPYDEPFHLDTGFGPSRHD